MQATSHPAVVEPTPSPPSPFLLEIEESVFKRLTNLANKEGISINELASALIKCLLLLHRTEVKRIIDTIQRNHHATS